MSSEKTQLNTDKLEKLVAETRRNKHQREKDYREKALKIFPWICARCGREFDGKKLRELTVHHKDNNHDNNPPDGSNWELLCLYCHDNEHARYLVDEWYDGEAAGIEQGPSGTYKPFADLKELMKDKI